MTCFIEAHTVKNKCVLLSVDCIESVMLEEDGKTTIYYKGGSCDGFYRVAEPYEKIKAALQEFGRIVRVKA